MNFTDIHAMVVHFPIALLFVSVGLEFAALYPGAKSSLTPAALITLLVGTAGAAVAVWSGPDGNARGVTQLIHPHENWAHLTLILFGALSAFRILMLVLRKPLAKWMVAVYLAVALAGLGMLGYTGYLGGKMVYEEAIGVKHNGTPVAPPHGRPGQPGQRTPQSGAPGQQPPQPPQ